MAQVRKVARGIVVLLWRGEIVRRVRRRGRVPVTARRRCCGGARVMCGSDMQL